MAVSLQKGQKISLDKQAGRKLTKVIMGLGWDPVKGKGLMGWLSGPKEVDLDASCLLFDNGQQLVDAVWFRQLRSKDGSIIHTGDNLTGAGEGDDEQIIVDLSAVPSTVKTMVFVVNSFTGQDFTQIENASCRLVDQGTNEEVAKYDLSGRGNHTAAIMAKVFREGGDWQMEAIGASASGRTFHDLLPVVNKYI